jgi:hypothetical protein
MAPAAVIRPIPLVSDKTGLISVNTAPHPALW